MKIGISVTSSHATRDVRAGARDMIERARAANQAGLSSLFVGDHHVTPVPYYQNTAILGRMLAEWGDREAGALYLLPLWNPVLLAEQVATLACIAEGPFVLQCALGADPRASAGMGVEHRYRPSMFEGSLEIMAALWAGEEVTHDGRFKIDRARISPTPPEPIEVWIGASAEPALDRVARLGHVWLGQPGTNLDATKRQLASYRQACARHGANPSRMALRRDIYVGSSSQQARSTMAPYIEKGYRGFPEDSLVIGDAAEVADQLNDYRELGFTDILIRNITRDQSEALATIERLAEVREILG